MACGLLNLPSVSVSEEYVQSTMDTMDDAVHNEVHDDRLEDMIRDIGAESFAKAHEYGNMSSNERLHCILDQVTLHDYRWC